MIYRIAFAIYFFMLPVFVLAQMKSKPVPIIFDSDMGPDYDDVGAIALLHAMADSGHAKILATIASTKYEGVAAIFDVFNTYFKKPGILIGVPKGKASELKDKQHWTDTLLLKYPHRIKSNNEVADAIEVYRKVLASQPDGSITIVTVGFLTNLSGLLQSVPDAYSNLDGSSLVKQKVKQLVCMAGHFPSGNEFNVRIDTKASQHVFNNWPTPVLLSGFEIGMKIKTGLPLVSNDTIQNSPVKDVFRISIPLSNEDSAGRKSWDQTAILVAIKGYQPWYKIEKGKIAVADDGSNTWLKEPTLHSYLVEAMPAKIVEEFINKLMMHQPAKK